MIFVCLKCDIHPATFNSINVVRFWLDDIDDILLVVMPAERKPLCEDYCRRIRLATQVVARIGVSCC